MSQHPSQCTPRVYVIEKEVARCNVAGGVASGIGRFRIKNPSVRLHLTVFAFVRPNQIGAGSGGAAHVYTGETWQLTVVAQGTPDAMCNDVLVDPVTGAATAQPLPDSYEVETGVKELAGVLNLQNNANGPGSWYVTCIWEPAEGGERMTDNEWAELIALCDLKPGADVLKIAC